ncbi:zinc ion binding [Abeliophyllum distichum]|uniref:Zinc ion binding n=1 Tax=Abeliophyllum distichum TaxID=126358 RepID=A0ABD1TYW8_9LAMI
MGCPMRVLKWTCDFHPDAETPIAPVWISFPLLPVHLRAKEFLFALSKLVGVPLRIDEATADLLRPSEARVCVEVNLEHKLPDRVWIERGESRSFWQPVVYEQLPHFCAKCRHMGHLIDKCRAGMPPLDVEKVAQATKPVGAKASKPITVPKPTVDPATKPVDVELPVTDEVHLVDRIGKGKGKEVVVEPRKQWIPLASSSSILPPVIPILPSEVHERPIHEHSSPVTTDMASQPIIAATDFDPLLDHMMSLPREYPMLSEPVQPVFDPVPHTHPDLSCHENVETSITADTASSIQSGGHQQGHFCRNSSDDLVGLGERQESDGFTTVQRKKSSKGIDIPRPNTRVTRSQTSTSSHNQSL